MIQLYRPENTNFEKNGDMTLVPISATVEADLYGAWSAEVVHPVDTKGRWKEIVEESVIKMPSFNGDQLFRVKSVEKDEEKVTATAMPIFLDSAGDCFLVDVRPTKKNGQEALDIMTASNRKYKGKSDIKKYATSYFSAKNLMEAINGDDENSFINRWGGEVYYDNFTIIINEQVGSDRGIEVRYGKNIAKNGIKEKISTEKVTTRIYPKAYNGYSMGSGNLYVDSPLISSYPTVKTKECVFNDVKMKDDASEGDAEKGITICSTKAQLDRALKRKCDELYANGIDKPDVTIDVNLVLLENADEYRDFKILEKVALGDTVSCKHDKLGISTKERVISIKYDSIKKKTISVTLGSPKNDFFRAVSSAVTRVDGAIAPDGSVMAEKIKGLIDGAMAQLKVQNTVAKKQEARAILFEDLDPKSKLYGAMALGTQGFQIASERLPDDSDWKWTTFGTSKGFFADLITAGTLNAIKINGASINGGEINGTEIDGAKITSSGDVIDEKGNKIGSTILINGGEVTIDKTPQGIPNEILSKSFLKPAYIGIERLPDSFVDVDRLALTPLGLIGRREGSKPNPYKFFIWVNPGIPSITVSFEHSLWGNKSVSIYGDKIEFEENGKVVRTL